MITIHWMGYQEAHLLPFAIKHWRDRFPDCKIKLWDNESTDTSREIALDHGCEVLPYQTNGEVNDDKLRQHKNSCWKDASTDWVVVADVDEMLEMNEDQLRQEDAAQNTIISAEGYNMVAMKDDWDLDAIKLGIRCESYDKKIMFKRSAIREIMYVHGGHHCSPVVQNGQQARFSKPYTLYHYRDVNIPWCVERHLATAKRMSQINLQHGWGNQYMVSAEQKRNAMLSARTNPSLKQVKP